MSAKHTKGPWMAAKNDFGTWEVGLSEAVPESGGGVSGCGDDGEYLRITVAGNKEEHDARLIAAAPDLLEALQRLEKSCNAVQEISGGTQQHQAMWLAQLEARDAIAKATGADPA